MLRSVLPLLALVGAVLAAPGVQAQDRPSAAASIDGWQRRVAETGTVFFQCRAASCPAGAAVSYRMQGTGPQMSLEVFRRHHEELGRRMVEQSQGQLARIELIEVSQSREEGAEILTAVRLVARAEGGDEFMASSVVVDDGRRFSMVSTARTEADARMGLRLFLPVVLLQTRLDAGRPPRAP